MDDASQRLRELLRFSSEDKDDMLRAAVDCYGNGDLSQAETILVGLMSLDEADPRPVKLLASTLFLLGRHVEAEHFYERALALDGQDPYTLVALGEIKLKALKLRDAIPLFERLFELDPAGTHPAANRGRELVFQQYKRMTGG